MNLEEYFREFDEAYKDKERQNKMDHEKIIEYINIITDLEDKAMNLRRVKNAVENGDTTAFENIVIKKGGYLLITLYYKYFTRRLNMDTIINQMERNIENHYKIIRSYDLETNRIPGDEIRGHLRKIEFLQDNLKKLKEVFDIKDDEARLKKFGGLDSSIDRRFANEFITAESLEGLICKNNLEIKKIKSRLKMETL